MKQYKQFFSKQVLSFEKGQKVSVSHVTSIIGEEGLYELEGANPIFYGKLEPPASLLKACVGVKFSNSPRTNKIKTHAAPFGAKPANRLKDNFCTQASMAETAPKSDLIFRKFGIEIAKVYKNLFPETYNQNLKEMNKQGREILPEYILKETPFTSGIVNKDNALAYHYDKGNFAGMQSAMIVLCNNIQGGHLVLPEYDVAFRIKNHTLILFDGQKVLHGVSKIVKSNPRGYRYSIVYYSMKELWKCLTFEEEITKYNKSLESKKYEK